MGSYQDQQAEYYAQLRAYEEQNLELHFAASTGNIELLDQYLRRKKRVNLQDSEGKTPLHYAISNLQLEAAKFLLERRAKVNLFDQEGLTPLHLAAMHGTEDLVLLLIQNGAKPVQRDANGRTPLHLSTNNKDVKVMKTLLQVPRKELINLRDNEGMTALHWASFHKRPNHTKALLAKRAREDIFDVDEKTALHWAAQNGSPMCCKLLLMTKSAKYVNKVDKDGNSCAHLAAAGGHAHIIKVLSSIANIDLNARDENGRTPAHWAAAAGFLPSLEALIARNCDLTIKDRDGCTPLDYARIGPNPKCVAAIEAVDPPIFDAYESDSGYSAASLSKNPTSDSVVAPVIHIAEEDKEEPVKEKSEHKTSPSPKQQLDVNQSRLSRMRSVETQALSFPRSAAAAKREKTRIQLLSRQKSILSDKIPEDETFPSASRTKDRRKSSSSADLPDITEKNPPATITKTAKTAAAVPGDGSYKRKGNPRRRSTDDGGLSKANQAKKEQMEREKRELEELESRRLSKLRGKENKVKGDGRLIEVERPSSALSVVVLDDDITNGMDQRVMQKPPQTPADRLIVEQEAHKITKQRLELSEAQISSLHSSLIQLTEQVQESKKILGIQSNYLSRIAKLEAQVQEHARKEYNLRAENKNLKAQVKETTEHISWLESRLREEQMDSEIAKTSKRYGGRVRLPAVAKSAPSW